MDILKSYRLNTLEEPTDEQLEAIVKGIGDMGKENDRKAKMFLSKKMEELRQYSLNNQ